MTVEFAIWLFAGAAAGGFVNGLAGFGTALFALGFWLEILPATQAVAIVVAMSILSGIQGLWTVRQQIVKSTPRLMRFLLPALIGVPAGITLLAYIDARSLKLVVGSFMLLYGSFFVARRSLPVFDRPTPLGDSVIGLIGGVLGGAASLSGAFPTMWCALRPWSKSEQRAILQPFNVAVLTMVASILIYKGFYPQETLLLMAIVIPPTLIFAQLGIVVFGKINDAQFKRLLIALMFVSGALILLREYIAL